VGRLVGLRLRRHRGRRQEIRRRIQRWGRPRPNAQLCISRPWIVKAGVARPLQRGRYGLAEYPLRGVLRPANLRAGNITQTGPSDESVARGLHDLDEPGLTGMRVRAGVCVASRTHTGSAIAWPGVTFPERRGHDRSIIRPQ
jgi:hypothetical protein